MAQAPRSRRRIHRTFSAQRRSTQAAPGAPLSSSYLPLHSLPSQRSASSWIIATACLAATGIVLVAVSVFAQRAGQPDLADSLGPIGALVMAMAGAPLIIGIVRMLEKPEPRPDRCGLCRYYLSSSQTYEQGVCGATLERHLTTRHESCDRFVFSERAMARDRLSEAPHITNPSPKKS